VFFLLNPYLLILFSFKIIFFLAYVKKKQ